MAKHDRDGQPEPLRHFHECENCSSKGDIKAATASVGEFLMARMSEREMAIVLTSLVLVLCEEQLDHQEHAFEDFVRHLRTVWTSTVAERRQRLADTVKEDDEIDKSNLH
jgi:hypothetical protein